MRPCCQREKPKREFHLIYASSSLSLSILRKQILSGLGADVIPHSSSRCVGYAEEKKSLRGYVFNGYSVMNFSRCQLRGFPSVGNVSPATYSMKI